MAAWALSLLSALLVSTSGVFATTSNATSLQVNVIIGQNGKSAFQCWSLPPFTMSQDPGIAAAKIQSIGASNGSLVFFDETGSTDAGLHRDPEPQWVFFLQGNGTRIVLPTTNETLTVPAGSFIIAVDTAEVSEEGHDTVWAPGAVIALLPFTGGVIPNHTVVNDGPCSTDASVCDDH